MKKWLIIGLLVVVLLTLVIGCQSLINPSIQLRPGTTKNDAIKQVGKPTYQSQILNYEIWIYKHEQNMFHLDSYEIFLLKNDTIIEQGKTRSPLYPSNEFSWLGSDMYSLMDEWLDKYIIPRKGTPKEEVIKIMGADPVYKANLLDYELWYYQIRWNIANSQHDRTNLYLIKNDNIIYAQCKLSYNYGIDIIKTSAQDWANNMVQNDLQNDIDCILNKKIRIGMRKMPVLLSWGAPDKIMQTITQSIIYDVWIYERGDFTSQRIHFDNGIVTIIGG